MILDSTSIASDIQYMAPGDIIEFYEIDATEFGAAQVFRFTGNTENGGNVVFNGISYTPLDFEVEGFELKGDGQLPEPMIRLSNVNNSIGSAVNSFNDLVGAKVRRRKTFVKYLDSQPTADPSAQFPVELFYIEQKTNQNKYFIEFKLVPFYDYTGIKLPNRQIIRDSCPFVYRSYNEDSSAFIYTHVVGCPYTGDDYFDIDGDPVVEASDDICGKRLSDCKLRFPDNEDVPYGGFPTVSKIRIY